ncbi:MAG: hypothetical protein H6720_17680 [Sandaracinus sp.]|nr:hypothetical protein [Sandaracinus sp.]MCB9625532.1 hypothetical protein [Sandaracinus sp.]
MSEFSDSYHLLGTRDDAVALLQRASARGAVLPGGGRFTTLVVHPKDGRLLEAANTGVLLHYLYAGDHGCWVQLRQGASLLDRLEQNWETGVGAIDAAAWVRSGVCDLGSVAALKRWVTSPVAYDEERYSVAEVLGLTHFQRLSSSDFCLPDQLEDHSDDLVWVPERPEPEDPGLAMMEAFEDFDD